MMDTSTTIGEDAPLNTFTQITKTAGCGSVFYIQQLDSGKVTIQEAEFDGCTATAGNGGAIAFLGITDGCEELKLLDLEFSGCSAGTTAAV